MLGFPDKPSLETVFHCWQLYYNIFKTKPLVVKLKINYFVKLYIYFFFNHYKCFAQPNIQLIFFTTLSLSKNQTMQPSFKMYWSYLIRSLYWTDGHDYFNKSVEIRVYKFIGSEMPYFISCKHLRKVYIIYTKSTTVRKTLKIIFKRTRISFL